jgi:hypothetical protein
MEKKQLIQKIKKQRGYTLLEYAAGAAVLMGLLYLGVQAMGGGIQDLLTSIGEWARSRSSDLS